MRLCELTLATPAENVAFDHALLDAAEAGEIADDVLRIWESPQPMVVVGRSSRVAEEVQIDACREAGAPILRRTSGGAAIVAGPGCLMYAVCLHYRDRHHLRLIDEAHRHILGTVARAVGSLADGVALQGTSDLTLAGRKFSGNSLRCKREHFLYHGTLLYDFELELIERLLKTPPRQPEYRAGRSHRQFVGNLRCRPSPLRQALARAFGAADPLENPPFVRTSKLVAEQYSRDGWNLER